MHLTNDDAQWLAGLLEGEGSFLAGPPSARNVPRVALEMTDRDVVARAARLLAVDRFTEETDIQNAAGSPRIGSR